MNNLNSVLIEGTVVKDPLFRTTMKGTSVCTFTIASNRFVKDGDSLVKEIYFFDIEIYGVLAEKISCECRERRGVRVVGRLKESRWQDEAGKARSKVYIEAEHIEFCPEQAEELPKKPRKNSTSKGR